MIYIKIFEIFGNNKNIFTVVKEDNKSFKIYGIKKYTYDIFGGVFKVSDTLVAMIKNKIKITANIISSMGLSSKIKIKNSFKVIKEFSLKTVASSIIKIKIKISSQIAEVLSLTSLITGKISIVSYLKEAMFMSAVIFNELDITANISLGRFTVFNDIDLDTLLLLDNRTLTDIDFITY